MRIAFRTDASLQIGNGHVMRCLTLADVLHERGVQCFFICRPHAGNLIKLIVQRGHQVLVLPALRESACHKSSGIAHVDWLGTEWVNDSVDTQQVLSISLGPQLLDWLVVDHYALDRRWEQAQRRRARRIMAIDDLADRHHDCDLLLDQNLGRTAQDYCGLLNPSTITLIGPQFALLRPEFYTMRSQSLARRTTNQQIKNLLISMGGVDKDNTTGQVLDVLKVCALPPDLQIKVVMGQHAPWLEHVKARAGHMQCKTQVMVGVSNIAKLMAESDLAIGASGGTAWERCCLGLPSILLVLAKNQLQGAVALKNAGAAIIVETQSQIVDFFRELQSECTAQAMLQKMSEAAAAVTDGYGGTRVADRIMDRIHA